VSPEGVTVIWLVCMLLGCADVPAPPPGSTAPPAPPCIHEVCAERPVRLRCEDINSMHYCRVYAIEYEHHGTCDRWASPGDGVER
jgi:hypothetical protein